MHFKFVIDIWLVIKNVPIISQHRTGQINLTASNLKEKSGAHRLPTKKKKVTIIQAFLRQVPNVPYVIMSIWNIYLLELQGKF